MKLPEPEGDYAEQRELMVTRQLMRRGISDSRVIEAFRKVPRHLFVSEALRGSAYADHPLPIGEGQTISQPYMVALMTQSLELRGKERVLEIGTGSGYQAAILAELASEVYTVERIAALSARAEETIGKLGYGNIRFLVGDGTRGWPEHAPYEGTIVTAGAPDVPDPLIEQLAEGGRMVIPVGGSWSQELAVLRKRGGTVRRKDICGCIFVPLVGEYGWRK